MNKNLHIDCIFELVNNLTKKGHKVIWLDRPTSKYAFIDINGYKANITLNKSKSAQYAIITNKVTRKFARYCSDFNVPIYLLGNIITKANKVKHPLDYVLLNLHLPNDFSLYLAQEYACYEYKLYKIYQRKNTSQALTE